METESGIVWALLSQVLGVLAHPAVAVAAALTLGALALALFRYQRCPHCGRPVARARDAWMTCRWCGRTYHRGLRRIS